MGDVGEESAGSRGSWAGDEAGVSTAIAAAAAAKAGGFLFVGYVLGVRRLESVTLHGSNSPFVAQCTSGGLAALLSLGGSSCAVADCAKVGRSACGSYSTARHGLIVRGVEERWV